MRIDKRIALYRAQPAPCRLASGTYRIGDEIRAAGLPVDSRGGAALGR